MASKLDVYQKVLNKRAGTFKDVILKKNNITDKTITYSKLFNTFYRSLIELIGKDVFCVENKNIGLTLFKEKGERINNILTSHSSAYTIEGFIDAGPYNSVHKLAKMSDPSKRRTINKTDIVTDRYYFYFYFPLDSKIGILMVESKENASIRRAVKPFVEKLFKTDSTRGCRVNSYFPQWLKAEFIESANLFSLSFEQEIVTQIQAEEESVTNSEEFDVKVTIVPKTNVSDIQNSNTLVNRISNFFSLKAGNSTISLSSFPNKKGVMKNEEQKKSLPFLIDKENDIRPIIIIDNYISPDDNGDFMRDELKSLCDDLLSKIKPEIYGIEHK